MALVRTDVSKECMPSIIRVTRIVVSWHPNDARDMFLQNVGTYNSHMA
jgi:hypothetical protein